MTLLFWRNLYISYNFMLGDLRSLGCLGVPGRIGQLIDRLFCNWSPIAKLERAIFSGKAGEPRYLPLGLNGDER